MFKPAPMSKVSALILDEDLEALTTRMHEEGLVQLSESQASTPLGRHEVKDLENRVSMLGSKVERMISLLEDARSKRIEKEGFLVKAKNLIRSGGAPVHRLIDMGSTEATVNWCSEGIKDLSPGLDHLGERLRKSMDRELKLNEELHLIRDLLPIKVPLRRFRRAEMISAFFFYLPADRVEHFISSSKDQVDPVHISVVSGTTIRLLMVMGLGSDRVKILTQIHRFDGELIEIPHYDEVPARVETEILEEIKRLDREIEETRDEIYDIAVKHLDDLKVLAEVLTIEEERIEALKLFSRTEHTILLHGWVPEKDLEKFERAVSSSTRGRYVLRSSIPTPEESASVPISLNNRWPFNSFEWVTKMYGMPHYKEVDPTPLIVPTFAVFFGTCLTDAGYGLILAFVSFFFLRKMWGEKVGMAFTLCGLATILMGWLTGGWFGNILYSEDYGPMIPFFKAAWVDPISKEGAIPFLALVLLMGIIHLVLGHITAIMSAGRKGRLIKGMVTHIGWILTIVFGSISILWSLLGGVSGWEASETWKNISTWGMVTGIVMGVVGYAWERSGAARVAGPVQFMYDILGHIADVISYSRLLALGISTAVNAYLIDLIILDFAWPSLAAGAGPLRIILAVLLGIVLSIGFVFLHLANMGLNCLSGFVHTMRLHFAEYFSKFYEAGGDEFIPFKSKRSLTAVSVSEGASS